MLRHLVSAAVAGLAFAATVAHAGEATWTASYNLYSIRNVATETAPGGLTFVGGTFSENPPTIGSLGIMTKYSTGFKNNGLIVASDATGAPQWAISLNAIRSDVYGMTYANGKLYVVGAFQNTLTIPPLTLTGSAGDTNSGFVVTINPTTGAALDSVVFSSTAGWTEATIGVNANGEVAVAGTYTGVLSVPGKPDTPNAGGGGGWGIIIKLDSNLDASWYQIAATSDNNEGSGCGRGRTYIDADGLVTAACFWSDGDLTISGQTVSFRGSSYGNVAFVRLGATGTGLWITSVSSPDGISNYGMSLDSSKNVYVGGVYEGAGAQLGTGADAKTVPDQQYYTGYFAKISAAGVPVFLKALTVGPDPTNPSADRSVEVWGVAVDDATSSVWVAQYYSPGEFVFAGKPLVPFNVDEASMGLLRYALDGTELWATNYISEGPGYTGTTYVYDMVLNGDGMPTWVGQFDGTLVAPPAPTLIRTGTGPDPGLIVSSVVPSGPAPGNLLPLYLTSISVRDGSPLFGSQRALHNTNNPVVPKAAKNATYIKMHKDSWSFKGTMNATEAPTTPADILANGVAVTLLTVNGTILDVVAYNATDCKAKRGKTALRRVDCWVTGQMGKLALVYQAPGSLHKPSNNATYSVTGSWHKRALNGTTAAAEVPLGVALIVPNAAAFGNVMPSGSCKVSTNRRGITCKQAVVKTL